MDPVIKSIVLCSGFESQAVLRLLLPLNCVQRKPKDIHMLSSYETGARGNSSANTSHDGHHVEKPILPPTPPRGCRKINLRSRFSVRGHFVARVRGGSEFCRIGFESKLEWDFAALALARNDTFDLVEQPFRAAFKDRQGRTRHHTFDYLVTRTDGHRIAVAVKVGQKARSSTIIEDLKMIEAQLPVELADEVRLFTDEHFEPWQAWNAHHYHSCCKTADEKADVALLDAIKRITGSISIGNLVRLTGLGGRAYQATVRAIFDGKLSQCTKGRIGPLTLVSRGIVQ